MGEGSHLSGGGTTMKILERTEPLPKSKSPNSNWNSYYGDDKYAVPEFIDNALWRNYRAVLRKHITHNKPLRVLELGGANSCYFKRFCEDFNIENYTIVDNNQTGLDRFPYKDDPRVMTYCLDLLDNPPETLIADYDIVLSSGLIEHFVPEETLRIVDYHFKAAKPGGLVLLSFPTPTIVYWAFRKFLEKTGQFPPLFERPITVSESERFKSLENDKLEQFNIWSTILTQLLLLYRKGSSPFLTQEFKAFQGFWIK
jgi:hypothetical protein